MNIFYQPEAFGLRLLNSMHVVKLNTTVAIWMRDDRKIFWGFWDHYDDPRPFHEVGVHELKSATDRKFCAFDINDWATMSRDVTRPSSSAFRVSVTEASTIEKGARCASTGADGRTMAAAPITALITYSRVMRGNFT